MPQQIQCNINKPTPLTALYVGGAVNTASWSQVGQCAGACLASSLEGSMGCCAGTTPSIHDEHMQELLRVLTILSLD